MSGRVDRWVAAHPLIAHALLTVAALVVGIVVNLLVQAPPDDFWSPWYIPGCAATVVTYWVLDSRADAARHRGEAALKDER